MSDQPMKKCGLCLQPVTEEEEPHAQLLVIAADPTRDCPKLEYYGHPHCIDFYLGSRRKVRERATITATKKA